MTDKRLLTEEKIELKALEYGREICDCPLWFDYTGWGSARAQDALRRKPQRRVDCWKCRLNFEKKYPRSAQLSKVDKGTGEVSAKEKIDE